MARLSTYTKDLNLTAKDMLAGSNYITTVNGVDQFETNNFTLEKITEYINGQIITDPSVLSLKANGGLVYETVSNTNYLAVDLSATNITGQLANSDLVNSTITINGTSVALGGSITIGEVTEVVAGTYLNGGGTEGTVTLNHDSTTRTDSTSSTSPNYGASFTVIDSIVTNGTGHITDVNTKTVTLPTSDDTNTTYTQEAIDSSNDAILRLVGSDSTNDDIKLIAGANITLNVNEGTDEITIASQAFGNVFTVNSEAAMIAATSTGGDLVVRTDVSKTFIHNGGTAGTAADFTELQFSGINTLNITASDGIDTNTTLLTQSANSLTITNSLATASERGGIQIGYTENGKNYPVELDSEKAYVNVPWVDTDTTYTAGSGLDLVGTEFSHTDTSSQASVDNSGRTYIQDITLDTYGHVTGLTSATETVTDTNDYVDGITVTGSGTKTITLGRTGTLTDLTVDFTDNDTTYTTATSSVLGLVKIGYTENGKNYPVELSSGQMFVNVPWTDNNTTYTAGTGLTLSGTTFNANVVNNATAQVPQAITTTANRLYQIETDDQDNLVVNVPWVDTDTDTTNWNFKADTNTAENISAGETLTFTSGNNVTLTQNGKTIDIAATNTNRLTQWILRDDDDDDKTVAHDKYVKFTSAVGAAGTNVSGTGTTSDPFVIAITSPNDNDNTTYTAGTGLSLSGTTFNANVDGTQTTAANTSTTTANRTYKIQVDDNDNLVVNVPWVDTDTNTTYSAGDGLDLNGTVFSHTDTSSAADLAATARTYVSGLTFDTYGHVTAYTTATETVTDTNDNYYLDGITKNNNILTFSVNGATNQTYEFGANAFNSTTIPTNNNQLTNGAGYITSYTETDTLANVVSRGNTTGGTLEVTGSGSWLTVEGNVANTSVPLSQGLAFGWNRSGGSNETEIIFRGSGSGHSSRLDIKSWDGSSFKTLAQFDGDPSDVLFPNAGNIKAQNGAAERILERSYDDSRWARLVSNDVGGELRLGRSNTAHVKIVTLGDSYLNGGDVGIGTTTPGTKLDVNGVITATGGTSTNWNTAYGWGNHASAGYLTSFDITTQTDPKYLRSNADDTSSGSLTVVSYKFNGNASNPTNTTATIYDQSGVGLTASAHNFSIRNYNGSSMVESARFTTGSLTVIGDVIAFGTPSDISFKENIKPIENALDKVEKLQGVTFDWKESDSILDIKQDIGFIAQDVQKVLPELVRENDNGKLSLRHQGIISVLTEAIKELSDRIKVLEDGSTK